MRRVQLFEFEDAPWLPRAIRDGATDVLDLVVDRIGVYDGVTAPLAAVVAATGTRRLADLCSGGGGTLALWKRLRAAGCVVELALSDRFPSASGIARVAALGDPLVTYRTAPVDAVHGGGDGVAAGTLVATALVRPVRWPAWC